VSDFTELPKNDDLHFVDVQDELRLYLSPVVALRLDKIVKSTLGEIVENDRRALTVVVNVMTIFRDHEDRVEVFRKHAARVEEMHRIAPGGLRANLASVVVPRFGGGYILATMPHVLAKTTHGEVPADLERWSSEIYVEPGMKYRQADFDDTWTPLSDMW
jgi:hypothetical protein